MPIRALHLEAYDYLLPEKQFPDSSSDFTEKLLTYDRQKHFYVYHLADESFLKARWFDLGT